MKSLFDSAGLHDILDRLEKLSPTTPRSWGTMDVAQMLAHCAGALDMAAGRINPKRVLIGRLIGPLFRSAYSNDKPFAPSSPTSQELKISDTRSFEIEKEALKVKVKDFSSGGERGVTTHPHPFFGSLQPAEWGIGMYKHLDHHLRQFGA